MATTTRTERAGHTGRLRLRVELRGGRSAVTRAEGHLPYAARLTAVAGRWARVVLVQTMAGPLAADRTTIEIEVGAGAALEVVATAATVALPCTTTAHQTLRFDVAHGGRLAWLPEPLILTNGCDLDVATELALGAGAAAVVRETVVLGRHGERAGRLRARLRCEHEGRALLHEATDVDGDGVAAASPSVLDGARVFGSLALLGIAPDEAPGASELVLAGPGRVLRALASNTASLRSHMVETESAYLRALR